MTLPGDKFPVDYYQARDWFRDQIWNIQKVRPEAVLHKQRISPIEDLTIDWIIASPQGKRTRCLILSTGLHGVEGFLGAAILKLFLEEYFPRLVGEETALLLVHCLNPWGMVNMRRVNAANVDLNRNFFIKTDDFQQEINPAYRQLIRLFQPMRPLGRLQGERCRFLLRLAAAVVNNGAEQIKRAFLLGQNSYSQGPYFSGKDYQPESKIIMGLLREQLESYQQVIHLDIHSGYGPRRQMSLVCSPQEEKPSKELAAMFDYPRVVAADPAQFYSIRGDLIDWSYHVSRSVPGASYLGMALEFGTLGDSFPAQIAGMMRMIFENQVVQQGGMELAAIHKVRADFLEMFFPSSDAWWQKALQDARRAFQGILSAIG